MDNTVTEEEAKEDLTSCACASDDPYECVCIRLQIDPATLDVDDECDCCCHERFYEEWDEENEKLN